ncbi:MAG: DEAD/DEAH box helicase [Gammaproteobacteria bacterium]
MPPTDFHPAVAGWFSARFGTPTPVQARAWPAIQAGRHTLLAAPTGSGKTLAAFLAAIDALVREGTARGGLPDETRVLYVSPLKALSNDIRKNLDEPLAGIRERLSVFDHAEIRTAVRTGDTPQAERARMRRTPPHILVTTPESLYILLTSVSGREMLSTVRTVIVDELHAVADTKRGAHLALSLERLAALCPEPPRRIGISATQKPMERMADFLVGNGASGDATDCEIVDAGFTRRRDLAIELPGSPLAPVMANEVWAEIYDRLAALVQEHRTTLVFVNTRRLAERAARHLAERLGEDAVTAHHGSLAREHRLDAEERLKAGQLRVLVATASLELGIDIGDVDLVCQIASPKGIATLLQRVGRSGHGVDRLPKGRLFPVSRDDLVECVALLDAVRREELDAIQVQGASLDVLAQQIVAEVAMGEWATGDLYARVRRAWPYRDLRRETFDSVVHTLADGYNTSRGRRAAHLHYDAVNQRLRARPGARLTAITNGGTIPDQFDYDVVLLPESLPIGTLNEDFAFESVPGDIFQLGNTSYRIRKVETGRVFVEDAHGQPPNIPFWFGEAPGRTDELSAAVSRLREDVDARLADGEPAVRAWLEETLGLTPAASGQLTTYLAAARAALGVLPTRRTVIFERFFDEVGDTHLVIHAPFGSRLNRAWGLALRKRFCRQFNFELQAAALEDSIVLSLGPTHSFPLEDIGNYLRAETVREVLTQATLQAPMFPTRWRWVATTSLAIRRFRNGRKVPPQFQRSDSDDLLALVFPDQVACAENLAGDRQVPDHPLVHQTLDDCLNDLMDVQGLEALLRDVRDGRVEILTRELATPSPLAQEIISARPYAFLDDAPAEERRTLAIRARNLLDPEDAATIGRLDPDAIRQVCLEAWPEARTPDELHDGLTLAGFITVPEIPPADRAPWTALLEPLLTGRRATVVAVPGGHPVWVSAERLAQLRQVCPDLVAEPPIDPAYAGRRSDAEGREQSLRELLRSRLETLGPVTAAVLAAPLGVPVPDADVALVALEVQGQAMRGRYRSPAPAEEWCDRRLLARIHRYTLKTLRRAVEPVSPAGYMRFLLRWHELGDDRAAGPHSRAETPADALPAALRRLAGIPIPAAGWEASVLPARIREFQPVALDQILAGGEFLWLRPPVDVGTRRQGPIRTTPVIFLERRHLETWQSLLPAAETVPVLSPVAEAVRAVLVRHGAMFFGDLQRATALAPSAVEGGMRELVALGLLTGDGFAGLRTLLQPAALRREAARQPWRQPPAPPPGRWSLLLPKVPDPAAAGDEAKRHRAAVEFVARTLLERYGVVFRSVLQREARFLPPWRELAHAFRRLEARGEIRGGRFVASFGGEQFALPVAIDRLREARHAGNQDSQVIVSAADPLNLTGIVTPGDKVPALLRNRVLYRNGIPAAAWLRGGFQWLGPPDAQAEWAARNSLARAAAPARYVEGTGLAS